MNDPTLKKKKSTSALQEIVFIFFFFFSKGPPKWRSQRVILGYFLFAGMANLFFQRVNFSVNIVCMVNHTAIENHGHHRPHFMNSTHDSSPDRTSLDSFRPLLASHVVNSSSKGQSISQAAQWEEEEIEFVDDVCITEAFIMKEKQEVCFARA